MVSGHAQPIRPDITRDPLGARLLGLVAPPLCLCCRAVLPRRADGPATCACCACEIEAAPSTLLRADAIDGGFAALPYSGAGRRLVASLKFARLLVAAELGAALIAARAPVDLLAGTIVPVPAAPLRRARRGFDPAEEIATALAGATGLALATPLSRRDLRHQRGQPRRERLARPPAVSASGGVPLEVLLVDDVVTTGATIDASARALRAGGAERVMAVALAAVPPAGRTRDLSIATRRE